MPELPDLTALLSIVEERDPTADPLSRLTVAEGVLSDLQGIGDRLLGYLVELARAEGCSWSDIGDHLGISRQAAQQRYGRRWSSLTVADLAQSGAFDRYTARAKQTLERAEAHARRLEQPAVGADHLLLAILDDPETLAVRAIAAQGVDPSALRVELARGLTAGSETTATIPIGPEARRVLTATLAETAELQHNYVGTEHMLLGLLRDRSSTFLRDHGIDLEPTRAAVRAALEAFLRSREP
ncbi:ClpA/ClpB-like protein [Nonomuraea fuscirosea]|uniref:ClpA/ClpB-like protein n=1 Tax=Nonomuraea fuscirosea TaxID=1291556 RepID=A0A2T0M7R6_9ACTN|nr:Clp protease N-terminal domain-containing protein [Nonomuraea fuscirosea]PRX53580.1 ClpA/ClpB-like protein [Nonomuraea fuscirosea]